DLHVAAESLGDVVGHGLALRVGAGGLLGAGRLPVLAEGASRTRPVNLVRRDVNEPPDPTGFRRFQHHPRAIDVRPPEPLALLLPSRYVGLRGEMAGQLGAKVAGGGRA